MNCIYNVMSWGIREIRKEMKYESGGFHNGVVEDPSLL
jgi:hypothetical protein